MRKNLLIKVTCFAIAILMLISIIPNSKATAAEYNNSSFWKIVIENSESSSSLWGNKKLNIKTYVNDVEQTGAYETLTYKNSGLISSGDNPGKVTITPIDAYIIDKLELDDAVFKNGTSITIGDSKTKTLKVYLKSKLVTGSYVINYYENSVLMNGKTEIKTVNNYAPGSPTDVVYKSATALGLSSDYKLNGDVTRTIVLDLKDSSKNVINIYYSVTGSYTINYYDNLTKMSGKTETKTINNYTPGSAVTVDYKKATELGLTNYKLDGDADKKIVLNLQDSSKNVIDVYYSLTAYYNVEYYSDASSVTPVYTDARTINNYAGGNENYLLMSYTDIGLSQYHVPNNYKIGSGSLISVSANKTITFKPSVTANNTIKVYYRDYNVEYYTNTGSEPVYTDAKAVGGYTSGSVSYTLKNSAELNLTQDYRANKYRIGTGTFTSIPEGTNTIVFTPNKTGTNTIKVYYTNGVIAVEDTWKRSIEKTKNNGGEVETITNYKTWDWIKAGSIGLSVNTTTGVWDGAYSSRYYSGYSSVDRGFPYATWVRQYPSGTDMRRFQTVITVPNNYDGNDFVRMKSVNQDAYANINKGNIVPINDNLFVFVYPENTIVNNTNYLSYLAFWAGTETKGGTSAEFNGKKGDPSYQNQSITDLKQTDGWYVEATIDNVGEKLVGAKSGARYVVDIFTQDYAVGGGMDKFIFEFVKNKAPRTEDDAYIVAKGQTLNVSNTNPKKGILNNDYIYVPEAGAKAELIIDGTVLKQKSTGVYEVYDANKTLGGTISNFNSDDGTFTFTPISNYIGVLEFHYNCYQKKAGQNVVDPSLKDDGKVSIYVLPSVTVNHNQAVKSGDGITSISDLLKSDVIYGWPAGTSWNSNWTWPANEAGINRPATEKSIYTALSDTFPNHSYIGYVDENNSKIVDSTNSSKTLTGSFSSVNKTVGFYYERGKSNLIVECYVEGTSTLLQKESTVKYKGESYAVTIPSITGYSYASNVGALNGTMPSDGGVTVKLYYKSISYKYKVEYYFNNIKEYETIYSKAYNSVVNSYLDPKEISDLRDKVTKESYIFEKVEKLPLTISNDESLNVIKVYYKRIQSKLLNNSMYKKNVVEPIPSSDGNFKIANKLDYTFGFEFTSGQDDPDIGIGLSGVAGTNLENYTFSEFKLYEANTLIDSNFKVDVSDKSKIKFDAIDKKQILNGKTYTITYNLKYNSDVQTDKLYISVIGENVIPGNEAVKNPLVIINTGKIPGLE